MAEQTTGKLLALDLDGTTLDDNHQIPPAVAAALGEVRSRGHILCFVTGRRGVDMAVLGKHTRLPDYSILNSGAEIWDSQTGEAVYERFLEPATAKRVIEYCLRRNLLLNICARDYWGVNLVTERVRSYARRIEREPRVYRSPDEVPLERIEGFTASENGDETVEYIRREGLELYCVMSEPGCYDIIPGGISKWTALCALARRLGIPRENIIAAGNYHNDIEMIRSAGVGVAVQNALPQVKEAADYVTVRSNNEGAVVEILEKFLL